MPRDEILNNPNTVQRVLLSAREQDYLAIGTGRRGGKTTAVAFLCEHMIRRHEGMLRKSGKSKMTAITAATGKLGTDVIAVVPDTPRVQMISQAILTLSNTRERNLRYNGHSESDRLITKDGQSIIIVSAGQFDRVMHRFQESGFSPAYIVVDDADLLKPQSVYNLRSTGLRLNCRTVLLGTVAVDDDSEHPFEAILKPSWVPEGADYRLVITHLVRDPFAGLMPQTSERYETAVLGTIPHPTTNF